MIYPTKKGDLLEQLLLWIVLSPLWILDDRHHPLDMQTKSISNPVYIHLYIYIYIYIYIHVKPQLISIYPYVQSISPIADFNEYSLRTNRHCNPRLCTIYIYIYIKLQMGSTLNVHQNQIIYSLNSIHIQTIHRLCLLYLALFGVNMDYTYDLL